MLYGEGEVEIKSKKQKEGEKSPSSLKLMQSAKGAAVADR